MTADLSGAVPNIASQFPFATSVSSVQITMCVCSLLNVDCPGIFVVPAS